MAIFNDIVIVIIIKKPLQLIFSIFYLEIRKLAQGLIQFKRSKVGNDLVVELQLVAVIGKKMAKYDHRAVR